MSETGESDPVCIPIDGVLDLHGFNPKEIKQLLDEYLSECLKREIYQGRIIHGKGTGTLRETVRANLLKNPLIESFQLGDTSGNWGTTLYSLKRPLDRLSNQDA
jgi:DNA-nicking Smr family endonuclease|tara:strand:- start:167 stop:478 length:312 start_codon:yes stop_codon:yes gene_type:complete